MSDYYFGYFFMVPKDFTIKAVDVGGVFNKCQDQRITFKRDEFNIELVFPNSGDCKKYFESLFQK